MRTLIRDLLLFLFVTIAFASTAIAQQGQFQFIQVNTTNGLSNNQVNSIFKDSRGFMWFGTMSGLNRYDGIRYKIFTHDPKDSLTINDNWINHIVEGPGGKLWINTNEGYNIYDPATERFDRDPAHMLQSLSIFVPTVQDIIRTREGNFWFIHPEQGLSYYHTASKKSTPILHSLRDTTSISSNKIASLQEDNIGNIWIVHMSGVIEQLDSKTLKVKYRNDRLAKLNNNLQQQFVLFIDSDNELWIYSKGKSLGVFYVAPASGEIISINRSGIPNRSLNSNIIMGIQQDDFGRIWIGTDHGGINLIDKSSFNISYVVNEQIDHKSLSENSINCLYKDNENIMWVGTYKKGINYYYSSLIKFPVFKLQTSKSDWLQYGDVNAFAEDRKGNIWIGTDGGGLIYFDREKNKFTQFLNNPSDKNSIGSNVIVSLLVDHNQKLWIGTYHGGLNSYDGKKFTRYMHDEKNVSSISDNSVWEIYEDSKQNLWIGTLDHGLSRFDAKTNAFVHYNSGQEHSTHSTYISAILEDKEGNLWIGTSEGIDVFEKATNQYKHYGYDKRNPKGLSNNTITCIYEGTRGYIWIGTYSGLNQFDPKTKTFKTFRVEDGLPENTIFGILEDKNHSFWISTTKGLSNLVLNTEGSEYQYIFRNYDETDGLQGMHFNENASFKTSRGEMIFGGAAGFNIFRPEQIRINGKTPQIVLTDFEIFNNTLKPGEKFQGNVILEKSLVELKKIEIPYKANFFSVEFAALNFSQPEKNNYKYKLDGFNDEWITADKNVRKATFTNLDPGVYTFHLKASNNDGVWNEAGIKLQITVLPPFWRTPIAYGVYFLIFLGFLYLGRRLLLDRERMKYNIQSKAREAEQMQELINERKKVEATREKLIAETKQSEELLRTIIDSTPDWIFIKDTGHRYILVNQAYATAMQSMPNELIGKTELELGFPEDVVRGNADKNIRGFWEDDRDVIRSKETKFVTQELYELDGGPAKIMSTVKVPLLDSFGYVWGVLGFAHDITSLKKVEESL
ncbi:MAG TPA: two-component regulator propeller domain-containing protein, partial [Chitinophagaceae bacterium]|nr:two-component regulator propeller domain-containing protein [Chitinophagaceae bacterium]